MSEQQTCLPKYLEALQQYTGGDLEKIKTFAAGFVTGQAEKVKLGACRACMFRPSAEHRGFMAEVVADAAKRFGLHFRFFADVSEFWLCSNQFSINSLRQLAVNSAYWHMHRGLMCGVPREHLDLKFHERMGGVNSYSVTTDDIQLKPRD